MDTNKMRDISREQFEEFFKANVAQLIRCGAVDQARFIETQREMWLLVWEASREAVVVELPSLSEGNRPYNQGVYDTKCRIEAQGVKCK